MPTNNSKIKTEKTKVAVPKKVVAKTVQKPAKKAEGESMTVNVVDTLGKKAGTLQIPKKVFGTVVNKSLISQAVRVYLANQRKGSASTKTRGEVSLTTAKWYRQKGTGRARHGAKSAPIFVHGGVAHGPKQKDYGLTLPQKMRRSALSSALSARLSDGAIVFVSGVLTLSPKTKEMVKVLRNLNMTGSKLVVTPDAPKEEVSKTVRAFRNIKGVTIIPANVLNTYEVIKASNIIFLKESIDLIKKVLVS